MLALLTIYFLTNGQYNPDNLYFNEYSTMEQCKLDEAKGLEAARVSGIEVKIKCIPNIFKGEEV